MKLLILLGLLLSISSYSQVDYPESVSEKSEILNYLWIKDQNNKLEVLEFYRLKELLNEEPLSSLEAILLNNIESKFSKVKKLPKILIQSLTEIEAIEFLSKKDTLNLASYELSSNAKLTLIKAQQEVKIATKFTPMTKKQVKELVYRTPDLSAYNNGEYKDTIRLFLFCREDRSYPCLFIMKDIFGNIVKENNEVWIMPALAKSARNIPFYKTNGETPTGVHTMNSVMLEANRQAAFGKFRRVILNWIPKSKLESNTLNFLPKLHQKLSWWKRASIGRDAGRKYLRIHGTGRFNDEPDLNYYPHIATSGCISTREGKYFGIEFKDQRLVLDQIMKSSRLAPIYSNEINIKGVLYVVNVNNKKEKMTLKELKNYGIKL